MTDRLSDEELAHIARTTSQYDSTCRALAAELRSLRAEVAQQRGLLSALQVSFDLYECVDPDSEGCDCYACQINAELSREGGK